MNQFLLALRSLAVAVAVFLVLAFLAARMFGGTLFPRPPRVDFPAVTVGGHSYFLSVTREPSKAPAFSLRQVDPTDSDDSVLVAPQSERESDAWAWAEVLPMADGVLTVRYTQRDGKIGEHSVRAK
ncbi:MAG: hypothetical protein RI990_1678 [Planctomycetota bacterium]